jgi:hypothetical protein
MIRLFRPLPALGVGVAAAAAVLAATLAPRPQPLRAEDAAKPAAAVAEAGDKPLAAFLDRHCLSCHDGATKKGGLDLTSLPPVTDPEGFARWVGVHDRVRSGEMPPADRKRPAAKDVDRALGDLRTDLIAAEDARRKREGRVGVRRMRRVEFENSLRDLLGLPGLRLQGDLPADGRSHGFDRSAEALDLSYVHVGSYLAAVDYALNEATPAFAEKPPTFKYRYRPWDNNRHGGKEAEGAVVLNVSQGNYVPLIGLERDPTFEVKGFNIIDAEPHATAVGFFRQEDADFRFSLTAIAPVLTGRHKVRVSAYSFWWDGEKPVATDRSGALGLGVYSTGEHFGTKGVPANKGGVAEFDAWLRRSDGPIHGTDNNLRLVMSSLEYVRDFKKGGKGPPRPCPGLAVEWIEIEGPLHDRWPPAAQTALFGDLPVREWTKDAGAAMPVQQKWPRGNAHAFPKDIYEGGKKRPVVHVVSAEPEADARRLLSAFLRRAFRRPVTDEDLARYLDIFRARAKAGDHLQDALKAAYRAALTSPNFLMLGTKPGQFALAERLSFFLWSSLPDDTLLALAEKGELGTPATLREQVTRMLADPRAERFVADFAGQWLRTRDIEQNPPDKQLYPEFYPYIAEFQVKETHAYLAELLKDDLGAAHIVASDFAMLNEPLARLYGIEGVTGLEIRKVPLPKDSPRGGFLTQGALLKVTANGTTTSPVKRGAFVMEKVLGIEPSPPPPGAGSVEPDTRGAKTIRELLDKHKANATCYGCHAKMDPYGFALESFDVVGRFRDKYRAIGGAGDPKARPVVNNHPVNYHDGPAVDCAGQLPDGRPFRDVRELRAMLAADEEALARAFVRQLAVYAAGSPVGFSDRAAVEDILARAKPGRFGLRTLLHELVQSPLFRRE